MKLKRFNVKPSTSAPLKADYYPLTVKIPNGHWVSFDTSDPDKPMYGKVVLGTIQIGLPPEGQRVIKVTFKKGVVDGTKMFRYETPKPKKKKHGIKIKK